MKASAWVFKDASSPQEWKELPFTDSLESDEVLVSIQFAAVCGSDVHTAHGKRVDPAAPLVLGHEGMGTVIASARASVAVGSVVSWASCATQCEPEGSCTACRVWTIPQKCERVFKYGHAPWPRESDPSNRAVSEGLSGCFATHILLRRSTYIVQLDEAIAEGVNAGALTSANCAGGTGVAAWRTAERHLMASSRGSASRAMSQAKVIVFGAGLVGLYVIAAAKESGAIVTAVDIDEGRLSIARLFGADVTVQTAPSMDCNAIAAAVEKAGGAAYDAAIEVCGLPVVVPPSIRLLRAGGTIVLVGMVHPASALDGVTGEALIRKCVSLVGVHNYEGADLLEAIALIRRLNKMFNADEWQRLFSPPMPLSSLPEAFSLAATGRWARVLVKP
jgi:D-arabinose 1-dehydrogenase-like Zn-dependent alcohol dehydrogenase